MANELKIGNKLVVLNNATTFASLSADPMPAMNGDMYYNTSTNKFRGYQNGVWQDMQLGGTVTLTGQALNEFFMLVGNSSNVSAAFDTSTLGHISATSAGGMTIKSDVITNAMINSAANISRTKIAAGLMNRLVINDNVTGGLTEAAAITAARALISDANGIPTHSAVTSTELGYLSGVTSAVQTQINSKVAKAGDTMSGNLIFQDTFGIDSENNGDVLNIGASNASTINIGRGGATVNILGAVNHIETTNLQVDDALITINKNGAAASGNGAGIEVEEDGLITGYFKVANSRNSWDLLAPATAGTVRFTPGALSIVIDQNLAVAASPTFVALTLSGATANRAVAFNGSKQLVASATTDTELGYLSGVTSAIQTQLNGKASTALSNLASVAINTSLISDTDNTDDLGSSGINWKDVHAKRVRSSTGLVLNGNDGANNLDILSNKVRRSKDNTNWIEAEYVDSTTLNANVSSPTVIAAFTFAHASFNGCVIEYTIKEATSNKTRVGRLMVSTDSSSNVSYSDIFSETAALGSALGLSLDANFNGSDIEIRYNNTHATNACTMRADIKRIRT